MPAQRNRTELNRFGYQSLGLLTIPMRSCGPSDQSRYSSFLPKTPEAYPRLSRGLTRGRHSAFQAREGGDVTIRSDIYVRRILTLPLSLFLASTGDFDEP